ncbi:myb family transcription factor EFM-like [Gossypium australe]|uniref:Myb family transcription factor EFM-like n=1 Tax=Gossypium australe TaxID=47621 RepID=A0A5B6W3F6_9ROSI|nr:myb family transcription factor EFM-like [Gossypium australe]
MSSTGGDSMDGEDDEKLDGLSWRSGVDKPGEIECTYRPNPSNIDILAMRYQILKKEWHALLFFSLSTKSKNQCFPLKSVLSTSINWDQSTGFSFASAYTIESVKIINITFKTPYNV